MINKQNLALMIMPESLALLNVSDHQPQCYHIYLQNEVLFSQLKHHRLQSNSSKEKNPNYLGCITFEQSGKVISFADSGSGKLLRPQIEDIIRHIHTQLQNPGIWLN